MERKLQRNNCVCSDSGRACIPRCVLLRNKRQQCRGLQMEAVNSTHKGNPVRHSRLVRPAAAIILCVALGGSVQANAEVLSGADLQKQIQIYSAASQHADPPAMEPVAAGRIWRHLGSLYEDAGMYADSETAYVHAIHLLQSAPAAAGELAQAIDGLGTLYMMRGDLEQAERAEQRALAIREGEGLKLDLPQSWYHLATLSLREHRFERARDYAQHAVQQLAAEEHPDADEELNARFVLGAALYRLRNYPESIAMMRSAMDLVHRTYQPDDFPSAFGSFLLGYVYWKSGNADAAQDPMQVGASAVEKQLGWEHPVCLIVMTQYAHYLRATHQKQAALEIENKLKLARGNGGNRPAPAALNIEALF
jgi:tetratricopeptide (TPR) repeat protein